MQTPKTSIETRGLSVGYGSTVIQQDLNFTVPVGKIFVIMGGSGCGKTTLMNTIIGLQQPLSGEILIHGKNVVQMDAEERRLAMRGLGVTFQGGALWSSMTLAENVSLPLEHHTELSARAIKEIVEYKLSLVGLAGYEDFYPAQVSGGMCKRAGLARAMALDPEFLFFDEPSAGLDPISAGRLDELIMQLRDSLGATIVIVTHELASIFAIGDEAIFLDNKLKTITAEGDPRELRDHSDNEAVRRFLNRQAKLPK
jgi:phospholipid/cholesterol/gamma-HCH transport system ATP-binding protein